MEGHAQPVSLDSMLYHCDINLLFSPIPLVPYLIKMVRRISSLATLTKSPPIPDSITLRSNFMPRSVKAI